MAKEAFLELQYEVSACEKTLKDFLQEKGICYSTYNYWRKKWAENEGLPMAPISIKESESSITPSDTLENVSPSGVTLPFPNGLRAHFGKGSEKALFELFSKSLGDVLS